MPRSDTDDVYRLCRGMVFEPNGAGVLVGDQQSLTFFVSQHGDVVFLEKQRQTWSEIVSRRELSGARQRRSADR